MVEVCTDGRVDHAVVQKMRNALVSIAQRLRAQQARAVDLELVDVGRFGERLCDIGQHHVDVSVISRFGEDVDLHAHDVEIAAALFLLEPLTTRLARLLSQQHHIIKSNIELSPLLITARHSIASPRLILNALSMQSASTSIITASPCLNNYSFNTYLAYHELKPNSVSARTVVLRLLQRYERWLPLRPFLLRT